MTGKIRSRINVPTGAREEIINPETSVQIGIRTHNAETYDFTILQLPGCIEKESQQL